MIFKIEVDGQVQVHHYLHLDVGRLASIEASLATLITQGKAIMSQITDAFDALNVKVGALETTEASAVALLQGLKSALDAALALGDPATIVAAVQAVSDKIGTDTQTLADAVAANTPATPAP